MKRLLIGLGALLTLALVTSDVMAQQRRGKGGAGTQARAGYQRQPQNQGHSQRGSQSQQPTSLLSTNIGSPDLLRMREEEKLARDVYTSLAKTSKLPIFRNISNAESQHMQAIERLIGAANGNAFNDIPGTFSYPDYQQLYQSLVASGTRSPLDALMVGAKIEEMDIADLQKLLTQTTNPQIRQVLEQLMRGSQNHLRAFASQIAKQGASYNAEFLTQEEFDQIASSSGQGHGHGSQGHGSQSRSTGKQFGFQGQNSGGQNFGGANQSGQGGRPGAGNRGRGR
ncbi:DUF2202 domain-containing protein [Rubripirellula reticaptiva]|uniref:DUF2202 domain-containing protein n=1 Tax=Rubripirellula reticaptiva TaxID=2528013 RepID=A0A5C6EQS3_9BACT|nr:DUF2202 domain-containing protein [Rubripirellula reticaptiva]TWU51402.1 hypothetical protein Poly59_29940 [Rubripirellula reticaptiva]